MKEEIIEKMEIKLEKLQKDEKQCQEALKQFNNRIVKTNEKEEYEVDLEKIKKELDETNKEIEYAKDLFNRQEEKNNIINNEHKLLAEKLQYEKRLEELKNNYVMKDGKMQKTAEQIECESDLAKINDELGKIQYEKIELVKVNDEISKLGEKYKIKEEQHEQTDLEKFEEYVKFVNQKRDIELSENEKKDLQKLVDEMKKEKNEPKKDETKEGEPKEGEPKEEEPKEGEPKKGEPKKDESKKDKPKKDQPKNSEPKKNQQKDNVDWDKQEELLRLKQMAENSKLKIEYNAKEDLYIINNVTQKEVIKFDRKSLRKEGIIEKLAEKNHKDPEDLKYVDTDILQILLKYNKYIAANYFREVTAFGKSKEERLKTMMNKGLKISYDLRGLYDKMPGEDYLADYINVFNLEEREFLLNNANNSKKFGSAIIKKGMKVFVMEKIDKIMLKSRKNKLLNNKKENMNEEQLDEEEINLKDEKAPIQEIFSSLRRENKDKKKIKNKPQKEQTGNKVKLFGKIKQNQKQKKKTLSLRDRVRASKDTKSKIDNIIAGANRAAQENIARTSTNRNDVHKLKPDEAEIVSDGKTTEEVEEETL